MRRFALLVIASGVLLSACGGGSGEETPTDTGAEVPGATEVPTVPTLVISSDFEQVCGGGTIAGATEYSKKPGIHPLLAFEGKDPEYEYTSLTLPEGWQSDLDAAKTELVACLDLVDEKKLDTCEGYEDDETGTTFDVELYGGTWELTLYAATTGEEIASGKVTATKKDCPFIVFVDEDEDVQREYADVSDQVRGFVKKYVAP